MLPLILLIEFKCSAGSACCATDTLFYVALFSMITQHSHPLIFLFLLFHLMLFSVVLCEKTARWSYARRVSDETLNKKNLFLLLTLDSNSYLHLLSLCLFFSLNLQPQWDFFIIQERQQTKLIRGVECLWYVYAGWCWQLTWHSKSFVKDTCANAALSADGLAPCRIVSTQWASALWVWETEQVQP